MFCNNDYFWMLLMAAVIVFALGNDNCDKTHTCTCGDCTKPTPCTCC